MEDQEQKPPVFPVYKRTVWVTNLPYIDVDDIRARLFEIFSEYGHIETVSVGPSGMTADVVYEQPWRAHQAVKRIRQKQTTLLIDSKPICVSILNIDEQQYNRRCRLMNILYSRVEAVYSVCVSNLALTVTSAALREFFVHRCGPVRGDPMIYREADGRTLYSFVTFYTIAARREAQTTRGTYFHLRRLVVLPCDPNKFQLP